MINIIMIIDIIDAIIHFITIIDINFFTFIQFFPRLFIFIDQKFTTSHSIHLIFPTSLIRSILLVH